MAQPRSLEGYEEDLPVQSLTEFEELAPVGQEDFTWSAREKITQGLKDVPSNVMGGIGAAADFLAAPVGLAAQGIYGIQEGIQEAARGEEFLPSVAGAMTNWQDRMGKYTSPSFWMGTEPTQPGYKAATDVLAAPMTGIEKGTDWLYGQGLPAGPTAVLRGVGDIAVYPAIGLGLKAGRRGLQGEKTVTDIPKEPEFKERPTEPVDAVREPGWGEPVFDEAGNIKGYRTTEHPAVEPTYKDIGEARVPVEVRPEPEVRTVPPMEGYGPREPKPRITGKPAEVSPVYGTGEKPRIKGKPAVMRGYEEVNKEPDVPREQATYGDKVVQRLTDEVAAQKDYVEFKVQELEESRAAGRDVKALEERVQKETKVLDNLEKQLSKRIESKTPAGRQRGALDLSGFNIEETVNRLRELGKQFRARGVESKLVDQDGGLIPFFHGTYVPEAINKFIPNRLTGLISFSTDPQFASKWASPLFGANQHFTTERGLPERVIPVFLRSEKPFDYRDTKAIGDMYQTLSRVMQSQERVNHQTSLAAQGSWAAIEAWADKLMKDHGYDAFVTKERGALNVHVPDSSQVIFPFDPEGKAKLGSKKYGWKEGGAVDPDLITMGLSKLFGRKPKNTPVAEGVTGTPKPVKSPTADILDLYKTDTRSADQMIKEEKAKGTLKDISKIPPYFSPDRRMTVITKNPVAHWMVEHVNDIMRGAENQVKELQFGADAWQKSPKSFSRGFEHFSTKKGSGYKAIWNKATNKVREEVRDVSTRLNGVRDFTKADFTDPKAYELAIRMKEARDNVLGNVNRQLVTSGKPAVSAIPGYFPKYFGGDFLVIVRDPKGKPVWIEPTNSRLEISKLKRELKKQFPNHTVSSKVNYDLSSESNLKAYIDAQHALDPKSPEYKAMGDAITKIFKTKGFGSRGIQRTGSIAGGYKGTKKGQQGLEDFIESQDTYVRQGVNFTRNQTIAAKHSELAEVLKANDVKLPNAEGWIADYAQRAKGGDIGWTRGFPDVPPEAVRFFESMSHLASINWLTTPKFLFAQVTQPANAVAKMTQLWSQAGAKDPVSSFIMGYEKTVMPDKITVEGMNWARRRGLIDSKIVDLAETNIGVYDVVGLPQKAHQWLFGKVEQEAVRTVVFSGVEFQLRGVKPNKLERFEIAAKLADDYMVNYSRWSRPMAFEKLGTAGRFMSQFTTYPLNFFGQAIEHARNMPKDKGLTFLTFMAVNLSIAGAYGMLGFDAIEKLFDATNAAYRFLTKGPENLMPSAREWAHTHLPDWLEFGIPSGLMGLDVSSAVSSPRGSMLFDVLIPPSVQLPVDIAKTGGTLLDKAFEGTATTQDKMLFMQKIAPLAAKGVIDKSFTPEGQPVPNPSQGMRGTYIPSEEEWSDYMKYGTKSLDWASEDIEQRLRTQRTKRLDEYLDRHRDKLVDDILVKGEVNQDILDRYVKNFGDSGQLVTEVKRAAIDRMLPYFERYMIRMSQSGRIDRQVLAAKEIEFRDLMMKQKPGRFPEYWEELQRGD